MGWEILRALAAAIVRSREGAWLKCPAVGGAAEASANHVEEVKGIVCVCAHAFSS